MLNTRKIAAIHASHFGHKNITANLYSLVDKLENHSRQKTGKDWSNDVYYAIAFEWIGKEKELQQRIQKLESEITHK